MALNTCALISKWVDYSVLYTILQTCGSNGETLIFLVINKGPPFIGDRRGEEEACSCSCIHSSHYIPYKDDEQLSIQKPIG